MTDLQSDKKNILWFLHALKTGGTSIRVHLRNDPERDDNLINTELFVESHTPFTEEKKSELKSKCNRLIIFTNLRCPVAHTRSIYLWSRKNGEIARAKGKMKPYIFPKTEHLSFSDWIRAEERLPNFFVNWYSGRGVKGDLEGVLKYLNTFDYVLDTSFLNKEMSNMLNEIGEKNFTFDLNVNKSVQDLSISPEDIAYIKDVRSQDYRLIRNFGITEIY